MFPSSYQRREWKPQPVASLSQGSPLGSWGRGQTQVTLQNQRTQPPATPLDLSLETHGSALWTGDLWSLYILSIE